MATMKEVAELAGVSIATVSNVINGSRNVKIGTARKVRKAIEKMNYRPNRVAQSLATNSSQIISVLISDISNPFFSPIVRGIEDIASESEYTVMVGNSDEDYKKAEKYLDVITQYGVDGLIISPTGNFKKLSKKLYDLDIPIILVNRRSDFFNKVDVVETDNNLGAYIAIKHLISLNHTRIGLISGPKTVSTYFDRYSGYLKALKESGLSIEKKLVKIGDYHYYNAGYELTKELLELANPPTAIFVSSGRLSRGAFKAIKEKGISLPQDLSFVAFDETEWAPLVTPSLTTVAQKNYEMGKKAATLLFERINNKATIQWPLENDKPIIKKMDIPLRNLKLKPELIIRESTGKI